MTCGDLSEVASKSSPEQLSAHEQLKPPVPHCLCGCEHLISHLPAKVRNQINILDQSRLHPPRPPEKPRPLASHTEAATRVRGNLIMPSSVPILNMKITNPFYCRCPHGRRLLSGERQQLLALSQTHFLWLQLLVPTRQAGSFLILGVLASWASHPPLPPPAAHHPLLRVVLLGLPGSMSHNQAGDRQQASFIKSASCPACHRGKL